MGGVYAAQLITKVGAEGIEETKRQLHDVGKVSEGTQKSFEGLKHALSTAAGFAIFGGVAAGAGFIKDQITDVIKATEQFQLTEAQTTQVLKSTHDVSGMTAESLNNLAEAYGKTTMFSADTVKGGENLLLTFTNIGHKVFPQATQAILDVSQAMGQDLKSSAIQVGKALGDPLTGMTALQRIGVTFSEQEKKTVKEMMAHNDIIGAQKIILHELSTEFGGSATAAGKTFSGQMAIMGNQLEEVRIKIGTALLPALGDLMNKYVVPLAGRFSDWMLKGGGLRDFQSWIQTASGFMQNQLIPTFTDLLNKDVIPLAQWFGSLWQDAVNLFQAFQQGQPYAVAIGTALASIGSAIELIKIEEFGAGLANTFANLSAGNGILANVAAKTLPELGQALGWTTTQAEATSTAIKGIGVASEESEAVVVAASAAETLAMGAATAGISLLIGGTIAAFALAASQGQQTMSQSTKQVYDSLGRSSDDMKARAQADALETKVSWTQASHTISTTWMNDTTKAANVVSLGWQNSSVDSMSRWQSAGEQMAKHSADTRAQMVLDAQALRDAFTRAAAEADAAWVKASNDMNLSELLKASGWSDTQIAKYTGQNVTSDSGTSLRSGQHIGAHASGIVNSPVGHFAHLAEQGGEWMHIPNPTVGYVPQGASVLPHGMSPSALGGGGSSQPIILVMDGRQVGHGLMPHIVNNIRNATGVRF